MKNESEVIHSLSLPAGLSQWIDDVVRDLPSPEWQDFYRAQLADKILRIFSGYMAETSDSQLSEAQTLREIGYVTEVQEQIKNELAGKTAYENSRLWKIPLRISVIFLIIGCFSFPLLPYIISNYGKF